MKIYFVDRQNCCVDCKRLLEKAEEEIRIYVFYSKHQFTKIIEKDYLTEMKNYKDNVTMIRCSSKKEVYYMEMTAYIAKICAENPSACFYVVSKSNSFTRFVSFWKSKTSINISKTIKVPFENLERRQLIKNLKDKGLYKKDAFHIYVLTKEIMERNGKMKDIYIEMLKSLGKEKGTKSFNTAKGDIKEFMEV